jgi:hypothetical protein
MTKSFANRSRRSVDDAAPPFRDPSIFSGSSPRAGGDASESRQAIHFEEVRAAVARNNDHLAPIKKRSAKKSPTIKRGRKTRSG